MAVVGTGFVVVGHVSVSTMDRPWRHVLKRSHQSFLWPSFVWLCFLRSVSYGSVHLVVIWLPQITVVSVSTMDHGIAVDVEVIALLSVSVCCGDTIVR